MAPKYKLTYFNVTGLGEPIRFLFAYGKIDFEDSRFERGDWETRKAGTPFGQVPILEIDGKEYNQSLAICRYLAKQIGIAGKTDLDALQADLIVDTITDFRLNYSALFREPDEAQKAKKLEAIKSEHNPFYLERFEKIVNENGGYFVNNQLTWADIFFASISELLSNVAKEPVLDKYSGLKALKEKVDNLPGIKEYRATRPETIL